MNRYGSVADADNLKRFYDEKLPKTFRQLVTPLGGIVTSQTLYLDDAKYLAVKTDEGMTLVDEQGKRLFESVSSPQALAAASIKKGLMRHVELDTASMGNGLAAKITKEGLIL